MNWKVALALAGAVVVASCDIEDPFDLSDVEAPERVATMITAVAGGGQTGGAGDELPAPLNARVLDQFGQPVEGVSVTFTATTGGGTLAPAVTLTDANGLAITRWTLGGTLGPQTVQATTDPATTTAAFEATAVAGAATTLELSADTVRFDALGDSARITVSAADEFGHAIDQPQVAWRSTNSARATVNGGGLISAAGSGTALVIASAGEAEDTVVVVVTQAAAQVQVTPPTDTLIGAGDTAHVRARVFDANGRALTGPTIAWSSSAESVATVDANGLVTAVDAGTVTIVAASDTASASATIVVRIPAALEVVPAADTLAAPGDTLHLAAFVTEADGDTIANARVTWASLDTLLARVDPYGRVTAVDTGSVSIVARLGALADTASISVAPDTAAPPAPRRPRAPAGAPRFDAEHDRAALRRD